MAKPPPNDDPQVTDLARYRKAKAAAARRPPPQSRPREAGGTGTGPKGPRSQKPSVLGSNPRAGLILAIVVLVLLALWLGPLLF
ncbi:hypothetical protein [Phenylobacterium sp. SCN 70-31]|uniref:hypothetical protein n=1 Tax=Phenylobacterium sp. SCN 70-31 TaxID=1660129 RepID=UPI00086B13EF|nr:hypothetical protein [Phenylobacterium sp. SCN 70-31]ODT86517.1 MAG: hypothetical protein ABS78_16345 [Phenylobacterium sp. SCN 70-31]